MGAALKFYTTSAIVVFVASVVFVVFVVSVASVSSLFLPAFFIASSPHEKLEEQKKVEKQQQKQKNEMIKQKF